MDSEGQRINTGPPGGSFYANVSPILSEELRAQATGGGSRGAEVLLPVGGNSIYDGERPVPSSGIPNDDRGAEGGKTFTRVPHQSEHGMYRSVNGQGGVESGEFSSGQRVERSKKDRNSNRVEDVGVFAWSCRGSE